MSVFFLNNFGDLMSLCLGSDFLRTICNFFFLSRIKGLSEHQSDNLCYSLTYVLRTCPNLFPFSLPQIHILSVMIPVQCKEMKKAASKR